MIVALYSYIKEKLQQMINVITMFYKIIFKNFYDIVFMLNLVQSDDKLSYEHTIEHNRSN